jgi:hypothetical protein
MNWFSHPWLGAWWWNQQWFAGPGGETPPEPEAAAEPTQGDHTPHRRRAWRPARSLTPALAVAPAVDLEDEELTLQLLGML